MKLHIGCGPMYIPGFFNVDIREDFKTDYCGSIFDLDVADDSVSIIWSCHFLEHLEYPDEVVRCLELMHRWLSPKGLFRIAVPDMRKVVRYYLERDRRLFDLYGNTDERYYKKDSLAERLLFFMRGWEHKVVFDFDLLHSLLKDAGFQNIKEWEYQQSRVGSWVFDRMPLETIYVEADK